MERIITRLNLGGDAEPELLHDRRGTTVHRVNGFALKITTGLMAGREGDILRLLGAEHYRHHGWEDDGRSWLLLRWIHAPTLWDALGPTRHDDTSDGRRRILSLTARAAAALAELHAVGWNHGDLQPDHILYEGPATHLIDLACAQGPADVPHYPHRGGLAHTCAPEIAAALLSRDDHVTITAAADVWSLGASLWWSWTGTTPITYSDPAAKRTAQLTDIAALRRTPTSARPWQFPAFEDILQACLAADPATRPTAKELTDLIPTARPHQTSL